MDNQQRLLSQFNNDFHTKEALIAFIVNHLETRIVENAIAKLPVASLADAIIELKKAFEELSLAYDIKQTPRGEREGNTAK